VIRGKRLARSLAMAACLGVLAEGLGAASGATSALRSAAAAPPTASQATAILATPRSPVAGEALRVIAASAEPLEGAALVVYAPDGSRAASSGETSAPTGSWLAMVPAAVAGTYRAAIERGGEVVTRAEIHVSPSLLPARARSAGVVWPVERGWDRGLESLYSAWIEQLFDDPLDADPSWHGLDAILSDPRRNLLFDHLGLGEDSGRTIHLEPDCADLPFFLRAYFAWKLGLPFGYSECSRGGAASAPRCVAWHSNLEPPPVGHATDVGSFSRFLTRDVAWTVHSGSARTLPDDDHGDLYPTRIASETITPGTVYADPYGHTLIVVRRIAQTANAGGILLAVDAQPDGTVARRRYWRGNFLFAVDPELGGAGFKHFRPVVQEGGRPRALTNREIAADPDYADFSLDQYAEGVDGFYDRMDDLLSPTPRDPMGAFRETIDALDEQLRSRVRSVANGEEYLTSHPGIIAMPEGGAIFETSGAWEDFATPSRDLRLLIAIDVVRDFPDLVARRPERYALLPGQSPAGVRSALEGVLRDEARARHLTYRRSDGSDWTLSLADVLERSESLETAYDPNDCIERRWGAPRGSVELATCRRHAPRDQALRMEQYRPWFHERRRPPRP
jgi:hypothetical protein